MKNSKISYDLCLDLLIEILTRLPTKSLLRFRSVSKSLYSCIGSPDFIRLHTLRAPKKVMIVQQILYKGAPYHNHIYTLHSECQLSSSPYTSLTAAAEYPYKNFAIVGSSNGIICHSDLDVGISLWNPSTRRLITVQDIPCWNLPEGLWQLVIGFGFDPLIDDYKILRFTKTIQDIPCWIHTPKVYSVYTLKTNTWCEIGGPTIPYSYVMSGQCLFNGTLHWAVKWYLTESRDVCRYHIMTFVLNTNVFSAIALPEPSWETKQVTIIEGYLAVVSSENDNTWIWVRKEEYASWSVAYKFKTDELNGATQVLQLIANGDLFFKSFLTGTFVFNPQTHSFEKLKGSPYVYIIEMCIEGLGLMQMGTSCERSITREIAE